MFRNLKLFTLLTLIAVSLVSCNSRNTDSGSSGDFSDIFIAGDSTTGTFQITLNDSTIGVSDTTGFIVTVKDANGSPVANARVVCDTEGDLAIIEPNTGSFITSDSGSASGVIGCEDNGSFRMACRLESGSTSEFVGVFCSGSRPVGFNGFPGAAGGGLGNGVADIDDGNTGGEFTVRLTSIEFTDGNVANTTGIDLSGDGDCDNDGNTPPDGTNDPETFTDTIVNFNISNNTENTVRFTSFRYVVNDFTGPGGSSVSSGSISLIGESVANGQSGNFRGLLFFANNGAKFVSGAGSPQITTPGFKNIQFTLTGVSASGETVTVTASQAASFSFIDRC